MALCDKPCCSAEARDRIRAEREAEFQKRQVEFERFLAERERKGVETAEPVAASNDKTYAEALAEARVRTPR